MPSGRRTYGCVGLLFRSTLNGRSARPLTRETATAKESSLPTRFRALTAAAAGIALVATAIYAAVPGSRLAYRSRPLEAAFEMTVALVAGVAAALVAGRAGRGAERSRACLSAGLVVLALSNLCFGALPVSLGFGDEQLRAWGGALTSLTGAALLAASMVVRPPPRMRAAWVGPAGGCAAVAAIALGVVSLASLLPTAFNTHVVPRDAALLDGNPVFLAVIAITALLFAVTCLGALRRVEHSRDEIVGWLAVGVTLAVTSRIVYLLVPSSTTGWESAGDLMRACWNGLLVVGVWREIRIYQRAAISTAVDAERSRIAREVHDGLIQDLAFISSASASPEADRAVPGMHAVAENAMSEARVLLDALARRPEVGPGIELEAEAATMAARHGVAIECSFDGHADLSAQVRRQLGRIMGEAITNAARHGSAEKVEVHLKRRRKTLYLRVRDDGSGFDPAAIAGDGFGLRSMRERASSIGAELSIRSRPGDGAVVEVKVP